MVTALRHTLLRHRLLAMLLVAAALVMKVLIPTGYMASVSAGSIVIIMCPGSGPQTMASAMPGMDHAMPGMDHAMPGMDHGDGKKGDHGKVEMPCAFSALSAASLAATDPLILALAIAFIMVAVFRAVVSSAFATPAFLRPPLRGPPATS